MTRNQMLEWYKGKQLSYQTALLSESAKMMIEDLKEFCKAESSAFHADPRIHAVYEGRREVWLRIQDMLTKNIEELTRNKFIELEGDLK